MSSNGHDAAGEGTATLEGPEGEAGGLQQTVAKRRRAGRPRIIETPEEFDALVDDYMRTCRENEEPPTFAGAAFHLGFADRRSFYDYEHVPGFSHSSKRARLLIESKYEGGLRTDKNPAGSIFALKNHGWSDRLDIQASVVGIDVAKLPPALLARIADGENPHAVLASAVGDTDELLQLGPGAGENDGDPA